jgi:hypothetical protein
VIWLGLRGKILTFDYEPATANHVIRNCGRRP